ncbi:hypothetical protein GCM10010399_09410 [Dactylosporangium fulvum]|uniref:DUF4175 domain-containing protein n=1 Tax=Dactylosporangium fulvum TaxID=53359 RepID=A0ABY5WBC6_9ACTN|nr:hypothetical protein [Dactylosporangium fulvum]UWP86769.1 hypothetical protein Dfulv_22010 [Dactylosporangium fulvum]
MRMTLAVLWLVAGMALTVASWHVRGVLDWPGWLGVPLTMALFFATGWGFARILSTSPRA